MIMNNNGEKVYLEILEYGFKRLDNGIKFIDLLSHLNNQNITFNKTKFTENNMSLLNIFINNYQTIEGTKVLQSEINKGHYFLKPEAISYLISHKALKESTKANYIAFAALIVAIILTFIKK